MHLQTPCLQFGCMNWVVLNDKVTPFWVVNCYNAHIYCLGGTRAFWVAQIGCTRWSKLCGYIMTKWSTNLSITTVTPEESGTAPATMVMIRLFVFYDPCTSQQMLLPRRDAAPSMSLFSCFMACKFKLRDVQYCNNMASIDDDSVKRSIEGASRHLEGVRMRVQGEPSNYSWPHSTRPQRTKGASKQSKGAGTVENEELYTS